MLTNTFGGHGGVGMMKTRVWVDEMDKLTSVEQKATEPRKLLVGLSN